MLQVENHYYLAIPDHCRIVIARYYHVCRLLLTLSISHADRDELMSREQEIWRDALQIDNQSATSICTV